MQKLSCRTYLDFTKELLKGICLELFVLELLSLCIKVSIIMSVQPKKKTFKLLESNLQRKPSIKLKGRDTPIKKKNYNASNSYQNNPPLSKRNSSRHNSDSSSKIYSINGWNPALTPNKSTNSFNSFQKKVSNVSLNHSKQTPTNGLQSSKNSKRSLKSKRKLSMERPKHKEFASYECLNLEREMDSCLENLMPKEGPGASENKIRVYGIFFEKVIEKSKEFGPVLRKIKDAYDEFYKKQPKTNFFQERKHFKSLSIGGETGAVPSKTETKLKQENQNLVQKLKSTEEDLNTLKLREKKILKVLAVMRKKGFPVEQALNEKTQETKKVPSLCLQKLKKETSASTIDTGGEFLQAKDKVPRLSLPSYIDEGFHSEFMSRFDEFSESWRLQIEKNNK